MNRISKQKTDYGKRFQNNDRKNSYSEENDSYFDESEEEENKQNYAYISEKDYKNGNIKDYIFSLFTRKIYAELYFAWCKDCNETSSPESAKYFRDELLARNNKDLKNFNFRSMRVGKNFLLGFVSNLAPGPVKKVELPDNMVSDVCMHNIKSLISAKGVEYLNLASNMISTEGLKIIQNEVMASKHLKYLNLGVLEGSFRRNNFSGEGGIILARILLNNSSIETLILQDNDLGEESGDKIGAALIQNKTIRKLVVSDNKIKNKGARSIIENGSSLTSLDLSNNEISPEVCFDLKNLITRSKCLKEVVWNGNNVGLKGINFIVEALRNSTKLKSLSLKNTSIGVAGIQSLADGLFSNKYLEILDIGSNSINFQSFRELCDSLNNNKIRILKCKNNLLGDDSMKYFAETILSPDTSSNLTAFDFSSCKIYDQGLIYLLNELSRNEKITWINLRDNYFSHEIDFVVLNFLEKNKKLTYLDLSKNRFSFQCLQKVNKIIQRNRSIQNNKEPNKLLVELYSLKYENTKLNELKDTLKIIENDNEKLRLNKADLRQDYEIAKNACQEKMAETQKKIEDNKYLLDLRKKELEEKTKELELLKIENSEKLEKLNKQYEDLCKEKKQKEEEISKLKDNFEKEKEELMKKIDELNEEYKVQNNKEKDLIKQANKFETELKKMEAKINQKKEEEESKKD